MLKLTSYPTFFDSFAKLLNGLFDVCIDTLSEPLQKTDVFSLINIWTSHNMHHPLGHYEHLYQQELSQVDEVIFDLTQTKTTLITEIIRHIVSSGGKRLRPLLTILTAKLFGHEGQRHISLAVCVEFLHTATLLHDDVVDDSKLRRGKLTANNMWNNAASVLVGDFLLSTAFQVMVADGNLDVLRIISDSSALISEGEVKQLTMKNNISMDEQTYLEIIDAKTAQLFSASCEVGAIIGEADYAAQKALADYGRYLGIAFQIVDDALDYSADEENLGKKLGDDFREGKVTLPVIIAYQNSNDEEKNFWQEVIKNPANNNDNKLRQAYGIIAKYQVLDKVLEKANSYVDLGLGCLESLPQNEVRDALKNLILFSVARES